MNYEPYITLEVNSKDRTKGNVEDFSYHLSHQIKFNQGRSKSYFMRIENVMIPKTFYDIDSTNNSFRVLEDDGVGGDDVVTATIPAGNYTITELLVELEGQLDTNTANTNAYTLSYDDITNKISFEYSGATSADVTVDTIANGSTLNDLLGFGKDTTSLQSIGGTASTDTAQVFASGVAQNPPYVVDLDTKSYVIVEVDITSDNYYDNDSQKHIGIHVPINVDRNDKQYFSNHDGSMLKINSKHPLGNINFRLLDEYNNEIDLNGVNWSCELNIYQLTELHKKAVAF
jgi:hypothetical protein